MTKAFREVGHEAFSCDLLPTSGDHGEWHYQGDVRNILHRPWDLVIAFPPCDHLAVSGARWFKEKQEDGRQQDAVDFFMLFTKFPRYAIENPVGIMSTRWRKPDQVIHPWQHGHEETKATCLWLKGVPNLEPTRIVDKGDCKITSFPDSKGRAFKRSKTYPGIALAMAHQWK